MATVTLYNTRRKPFRHLAAFLLFLLFYVHPVTVPIFLPVSASSLGPPPLGPPLPGPPLPGPPLPAAAPIQPETDMGDISSYLDDPDFGTREEDWPDPDVDSSTEEGAEIM